MTLTDVLAAALCWFAAGLFTTAAFIKLRDFPAFTGFVAGYRLLPPSLVRPAGMLLVSLEVLAVVAVLLGEGLSALVPAGLLFTYGFAMSINLLRGRRDIDCGCGGTPMPIGWTLVLRNLVLGALVGWAVIARTGPALLLLPVAGLALAAGAALVLGLLYAAFNQLEANRATHRRLWMVSA
ncbi:MAG: MauE/DoxX family redox-associated membrane protein [Pseudomonadales bacterium]